MIVYLNIGGEKRLTFVQGGKVGTSNIVSLVA